MPNNRTGMKAPANWYGPSDTRIAWCQWAPNGSAAQTILDGAGVQSVARNSAGLWTITLLHKPLSFIGVMVQPQPAQAAVDIAYMRALCVDSNPAARTVQVTYRSVAFASVASGDAATDALVLMRVIIAMRMNG